MLHHLIVGEGKPILILHGSTLDHRHMMETLEPVFESQSGWRRIYVDLPGHGQSPPQDNICSQDDLLATVMEFFEQVLPGERFAVIGESRGSYLARGIVHLDPQRVVGAALFVPGGSPSADPGRLPQHQVMEPDPLTRLELTEEERGVFDNMMVVQRRDIVEKWRRSKGPAKKLWSAEQEARVDAQFDFTFHERGEKVVFDGPSLIIAGRQDSMSGHLDSIDLLDEYPRASLAVLDAAGHGLAWERPELVTALVRDWLARIESRY
ncbi:MAG: alpha/beta hydrolase [Rhizobiaceae bacterium]